MSRRGGGSRLGSIDLSAYTASLMTFPAEKVFGSTPLRREAAILSVAISLVTAAHSAEPGDGLVGALGAEAYRARAAAATALRAELARVDEQAKDWIAADDAADTDAATAHDSDGARALYRACINRRSRSDLDVPAAAR